MSFVWRTGSVLDPETRSSSQSAALATRIAVTSVLGLGVLYFTYMAYTFSQYGEAMDKAWKNRVQQWIGAMDGYVYPGVPQMGVYPGVTPQQDWYGSVFFPQPFSHVHYN